MNPWLFETLVRHAPMGIAFVDLEFRFRFVNDVLAAINGLPPQDHIGRTVQEVIPDVWPQLEPIYRRVLETGSAVTDVEISGQVASTPNENRHWLTAFYPVRDADNVLSGIGAMTAEVTEQKLVEANYRAVLAAIPDLLFELSSDGTHLNFHAPREQLLFVQPDRILGRRAREILPADVAGLFEGNIAETLRSGAMQIFEYSLAYPDAERTFDARMVPKGPDEVLVVVRDITEQKRSERQRALLEGQLRQAQKMEAIGQLAGGIAHDFNNLLTVINGYSDLLIHTVPASDPMRGPVAEIRNAGERARTLTRQLLMFSRRQVLEPKIVDLNEVIRGAETMLRRLIEADVRLTTVLQPHLHSIKADAGQLEQTVLNLCVNARDAMPRGGSLTIETRDVSVRASDAEALPEVPAGEYVMLTVGDTGSGMDATTKAKVFEPFFTTKGPGKGTGLGLAVVFGVVKQSGGHVQVATELGRGTTFALYFPRVLDAVTPLTPPEAAASAPRGHETIFLVEDDDAVRNFARLALQRYGYEVVEAGDGEEAVRVLRNYDGPLHLLVSDIVMPKIGGRELARLVVAIRPGVKVLYLSGYTDDAVLKLGIVDAELNFLQKPFSPATLATAVRRVLDRT